MLRFAGFCLRRDSQLIRPIPVPECERPYCRKQPVNPWIFNQDYPIPAGETVYEANLRIPIPADVDPGEYHFMIRVTDASGWQQLRSVSIRISENGM